MTTIAIITMIFLPGTFVTVSLCRELAYFIDAIQGIFGSNFMASPERDYPDNTNVLFSRQWWILPAVTIPLTLLVIVIWYIWRRYVADSFRQRAGPIFGEEV